MVILADALAVLYPTALPREDYLVIDRGNGPSILRWDEEKLGPQPTAEQLAAVTQEQVDALRTGAVKAAAKTLFDAVDAQGRIIRCSDKLVVDEINLLRQWITAFKTATAAATSLNDLKTRVAALANMPDRTYAQARTAIQNLVDGE